MATSFTPAQLLGSKTARAGFSNEQDIRNKFNNWKTDLDAQDWLVSLGHQPSTIKSVLASKAPHGIKPDILVEIVDSKNQTIQAWISIKLVSNITHGFNQVDKRWVNDYARLWSIPPVTTDLLKLFTGDKPHSVTSSRDARRLFLTEFSFSDQQSIKNFFTTNKSLIISELFEGRGIKANWMMVTAKSGSSVYWKIESMSRVLALFSTGPVAVTTQGSLKIGLVTMQRKGGDNGRPTANMLQFKANPLLLF
ncbi:type II restriction endonuclease [Polynucleobacter sp. 73C-SIWE]|uniref:hypothetical protein n=1 Tax=Polynucleobacter sp. 73C-SIWE TaxID=2689098 RepID=UPI001C0CD462|nr:type II restriction endonuclease [Polynucleobacter sp. 73C-SIWE]